MRISDWSSDVCSSDLKGVVALGALEVRHNDAVGSTSALARLHEQRIVSRGDLPRHGVTHRHELDDLAGCELNLCRCAERAPDLDHVSIGVIDLADTSIRTALRRRLRHRRRCRHGADRRGQKQDGLHRVGTSTRSEEHTSELQSLMRISYAVFCLKKKTNTTTEKPD